jgi:hypothetical protein
MRFLTVVLYVKSATDADLQVPISMIIEAKPAIADPLESGGMLLQA